jgi:hypothetical protein
MRTPWASEAARTTRPVPFGAAPRPTARRVRIQRFTAATCFSLRRSFSFGGISRSGSAQVIERNSGLASGSPGRTAGVTRFAAAQQSRTTGELEVAFDLLLGAVTRKTLGFENGIHARSEQNLSFAGLVFRRGGRRCHRKKVHRDNKLCETRCSWFDFAVEEGIRGQQRGDQGFHAAAISR